MRHYYGSNVKVRILALLPVVRALDFGWAFYSTTELEFKTRAAIACVNFEELNGSSQLAIHLREDVGDGLA